MRIENFKLITTESYKSLRSRRVVLGETGPNTEFNMTATDQMRAMLDQLMGTSRNGMYIIYLQKKNHPTITTEWIVMSSICYHFDGFDN